MILVVWIVLIPVFLGYFLIESKVSDDEFEYGDLKVIIIWSVFWPIALVIKAFGAIESQIVKWMNS